MEVLEAENSTLMKKLIESMHEVNTSKESSKTLTDDLWAKRQLMLEKDEQLLVAKDKLKTIAARSIEGFQQTDEYNTVLFNWYFKGFELLRCAPEEICLDLSFFFRSIFGTIQSNLKTMHVAPFFNGLFDVNVMVKLFSFIVLPNAGACQMIRFFSFFTAWLGEMLPSVMCLLC